jgi:hypothetical protein
MNCSNEGAYFYRDIEGNRSRHVASSWPRRKQSALTRSAWDHFYPGTDGT